MTKACGRTVYDVNAKPLKLLNDTFAEAGFPSSLESTKYDKTENFPNIVDYYGGDGCFNELVKYMNEADGDGPLILSSSPLVAQLNVWGITKRIVDNVKRGK